jgi:hypothetical protein
MLDSFHIIKNLRKKLKDSKILQLLIKAIYADSEAEYNKFIK